MKSEKGALVLYVSVACLFLLIVGITAYIGVSNKQAAQIAELKRIEESYNTSNVTAEELYKSYDGGDVIPIYTPEQFAKVGSGEEVYVKETGKFYTFSVDKTYMFYGVPEDLTNLLNQLKQEIKDEVKVEIGTGAGTDQGTVTSGILKLTRSTNQLVNSLTITATAESENGIITYVNANREEKIYSSGTKSIEETFTVTQNGNYVFSVVEENGEISDATMVITNIVSDSIFMIPSTTNWTNKDVILTITWPNGSEKGVKEIQINDGDWTRYTGLGTTLTISENCTVKARVTNGTDEMKTNSVTISNIDKADPIVVAKSIETAKLKEDGTVAISDYFTYSANGIAPISKVEYTTNGTEIDGTAIPLGGEIKCTVTKANGAVISKTQNIQYLSGGNTTEIANNAEIYYGREITNYTDPSGDPDIKWQIYYADKDSDTIYLIADSYARNSYVPQSKESYSINKSGNYNIYFSSIYQAYTGSASITDARVKKLISWVSSYPSSTNTNIRSVAYLLDIDLWNTQYKDSTYGDYAIGGPTIELFCKSYKDTHPDRYIECADTNSYGYKVKWSDGSYEYSISGLPRSIDYTKIFRNYRLYVIPETSKANYYWLASPSAFGSNRLLSVGCSGGVDYSIYRSSLGVRPLVCLQSGVQLVSNGDGTYKLSK